MKITGNTILITGGASGIGFGLAEAFVKAGNQVLICGRRASRLKEAQKKLPELAMQLCDVSRKEDREDLFNWVKKDYPGLNILINNAGISRSIDFKKGMPELVKGEDEIEVNFVAPVQLSAYFIPLLLPKAEAAIVNVSSGLGFVPMASTPLYCATKAAVHSFTLSLRFQLKDTPVKVFEIIPPIVETDLGKDSTEPSVRAGHQGIAPAELAASVLQGMQNDEYEIVSGIAKGLMEGSRQNFAETFRALNSH
jgi:uncharacterized oxidoreductase